jgi:hypothetical protein
MAIHTTTAAVNPHLAKADIDIAALPFMKSSPCFSAAARIQSDPARGLLRLRLCPARRRLAERLCTFPASGHNRVRPDGLRQVGNERMNVTFDCANRCAKDTPA